MKLEQESSVEQTMLVDQTSPSYLRKTTAF